MLKIGEFAKICNVSTQTLRYYDAEKILCADAVDQYSGYRYYHPDKIQVYQKIVALKDMGFSLEEIKTILYSSDEETITAYLAKKNELREQVLHLETSISKLNDMYTRRKGLLIPLEHQMDNLPFEDDPDVVGLWELCGRLTKEGAAKEAPDPMLDLMEPWDQRYRRIYFLPGGAYYWMFGWSRGKLYRLAPDYHAIIPNAYRLFEHGGTRYMCLSWVGKECVENAADPTPLLYRQLDQNHYTEKETHAFRDDVQMPFEPDDALIGTWDVVDVVRDPDSFSPDHLQWKGVFYILKIRFMHRGMCYKTRFNYKQTYTKGCSYTKGCILDKQEDFAEHYFMREIDGETYLIVEHKSGDYAFMGKINAYYVYKKRKEE